MMKRNHIIGLVACYFECIIFAGQVFGWPSLVFIFKQENIFCDLVVNSSQPQIHSNATTYHTPHHDVITHNDVRMDDITLTPVTRAPLAPGSRNGQDDSDRGSVYECSRQDDRLAVAWAMCLTCYGVWAFCAGVLYDRYGLALVRIIATLFYVPAILIVAFVTAGTSWLLYIAVPLIGMTCITFILANSQVCRLAGRRTPVATVLYVGGVQVSTVVYLIAKFSYEAGISRQYYFSALAVLAVCTLVNTLVVLPRYKIYVESLTSPGESTALNEEHGKHNKGRGGGVDGENQGQSRKDHEREESEKQQNCDMKHSQNHVQKADDKQSGSSHASDTCAHHCARACACFTTLRSTVFSVRFVLLVLWMGMLHVRIQTYVGGVNMWLNEVFHENKDKVSEYTNIYAMLEFSGLFVSVLAMFVVNIRRNGESDSSELPGAALMVPPLLVTSAVSTTLSICLLLPYTATFYMALGLGICNRVFIYGVAVSYMSASFPVEQFGRLYGICFAGNGAFSPLVKPLLSWADDDGFQPVNYLLLCVSVLSFAFPVYTEIEYRISRARVSHIIDLQHSTDVRK